MIKIDVSNKRLFYIYVFLLIVKFKLQLFQLLKFRNEASHLHLVKERMQGQLKGLKSVVGLNKVS